MQSINQKQPKRIGVNSRKSSTVKQARSQRSQSNQKNQQMTQQCQLIGNPGQSVINSLKSIYQQKFRKQQLLTQSRKYADQIYEYRHRLNQLQRYIKKLKDGIESLHKKRQESSRKTKKQQNIKQIDTQQNQNTLFQETQQLQCATSKQQDKDLKKNEIIRKLKQFSKFNYKNYQDQDIYNNQQQLQQQDYIV